MKPSERIEKVFNEYDAKLADWKPEWEAIWKIGDILDEQHAHLEALENQSAYWADKKKANKPTP